VARLLGCFGLLLILSCPVTPQAWLPAKGEVDLAYVYQNIYTADHLFGHGERVNSGRIYLQGMLMDATYGITDRLAMKIGLPVIVAKYSGTAPHQLPADNGNYHGTSQDFSLDMRYNVSKNPMVVTPFVTVIVPSHEYRYFAHSAVGRDLREARVGINLGRRLDPLIRNGFMQARLSYSFVERVLNVYHDSAYAELEFGYFLTRRLALIGLGTGQDTFGGLVFPRGGFPQDFVRNSPLYPHHDQLVRTRLIDLGGGAAYQVNPRFAIFGAAVSTLWGTNVHAVNSGITFGMNWTFQTRGERSKYARSQALGGNDAIVQGRCVCPKK
jgi:hypothetical protein